MASQAIPLTLIAPPAHAATGSAVAATAGSSSPPPSTGVTQVTTTAGPSSPASTPSALASPIQAPTGPPTQVPNQIYIHRSPWDALKLLRQWTRYAVKIFGAAAGLVAAYIALSITVRLPLPRNNFYIFFNIATSIDLTKPSSQAQAKAEHYTVLNLFAFFACVT